MRSTYCRDERALHDIWTYLGCGADIAPNNDTVVCKEQWSASTSLPKDNVEWLTSLKGLQRQLLNRLDPLLLHLLHLPRKHRLRRRRAINTIRFHGNHYSPPDFQIQVCVQAHNTRLIWLRHVCEDDVYHGDEHAVAERVARVFDNGDDVRAVRSHVNEISAGAVREFDGEDRAFGADDVGDVGDGGAGCGA